MLVDVPAPEPDKWQSQLWSYEPTMTNPRGTLKLLLKDIPVRLTSLELCTAGLLLRAEDGRLWRVLHSLPPEPLNSEPLNWEPVSASSVTEGHTGTGVTGSLTLPPLCEPFVPGGFRTVRYSHSGYAYLSRDGGLYVRGNGSSAQPIADDCPARCDVDEPTSSSTPLLPAAQASQMPE